MTLYPSVPVVDFVGIMFEHLLVSVFDSSRWLAWDPTVSVG
tara:strand:- start:995 stop:1117 length:123 start_codon:yes stop_codon:yes gene_type:complete